LGTDKATQELAAQAAGVLTILAKEGATVPVDAVIAQIDTAAKAPSSPSPLVGEGGSRSEPGEGKKSKTVPSPAGAAPPPSPARGEAPARAPRSPEPGPAADIPSPAAARILAEADLSPSQVKGTGPGGRITKEDALKAQESGIRSQEARPANG